MLGRCYPVVRARYPLSVPEVVVATDSPLVMDRVRSVIEEPGTAVRWLQSGRAVLPSLQEHPADLVIVDMQIGSMGGLAVAMDIALEVGAGRLEPTPVLVLLDRRADVFLARRTAVEGWLLKPLDPLRTRDAVQALMAGERYYDRTFSPVAQ
jgi:DNA-binding NarL/FixJ family response regulator